MERIKVLHIIGGGEFGGAEQHLLTLMRHIDRAEFDLHAACLFTGPLAPLIRDGGFPVHVFPMRNKADLSPIGGIASLIKREGFCIIHTHGVRANLIGRLAARRAGAGRVVTTVHSVLAFDYNRTLDRWINRLSEFATRRITGHFITVCDMLAGQLRSQGIPGDRITTIHNGLELEKYDPEVNGTHIRQEFGIGQDVPVAGIVARLHPVKGHIYLLEAAALAARKIPGLRVMIVGTGPDRPGLEEAASRLGINGNIIFTGFRKDIPEVISSLDCLVLPSLSEGLSLTVMEGMAMKKPVIATAVGGTPEIITPGQDGLLVPPADVPALAEAIVRVVSDPEPARKMAEEARRTIEERFTAGLMAEKTAGLYRNLLCRKGY